MARGLVDGFGGVLAGKRYLIHDRGAVFTEKFGAILSGCGVEAVKLPARAPNLNAHLERWIRSIREGVSEPRDLVERGSTEKSDHGVCGAFHAERPHQGMGNKIIAPEFGKGSGTGQVKCRKRLGGLLRYYYREAA